MITDWRFYNELDCMLEEYPNLLTCRLFRSDVPIPPDNVVSEHSLKDYATTLLLIPDKEGEFEKAVKIFPQYTGYIKT
jgi:hypothetical protein